MRYPCDNCFDLTPVLYTQLKQIFKEYPSYLNILGTTSIKGIVSERETEKILTVILQIVGDISNLGSITQDVNTYGHLAYTVETRFEMFQTIICTRMSATNIISVSFFLPIPLNML